LARHIDIVKTLKVAHYFPSLTPEQWLQKPLAQIFFLYSGIQVLEGNAVPEKHLSPEIKKLVQAAETNKDAFISVLDELRGTTS